MNNVRSSEAEEEEDDEDDEPHEEQDETDDDDDICSVAVVVSQEHSSSNDRDRVKGRPTGLMSAKRSRFCCNLAFISKERHRRYLSLFLVKVDFETLALSTTISLDWINSSSVIPSYRRSATNVAMNSCNGVIIMSFLSFVFVSLEVFIRDSERVVWSLNERRGREAKSRFPGVLPSLRIYYDDMIKKEKVFVLELLLSLDRTISDSTFHACMYGKTRTYKPPLTFFPTRDRLYMI